MGDVLCARCVLCATVAVGVVPESAVVCQRVVVRVGEWVVSEVRVAA